MKIVEYMIKNALIGNDLAEHVQSAIDDGWQPYGAPIINGSYVYQSMVKYEVLTCHETTYKGTPISLLNEDQRAEYEEEWMGCLTQLYTKGSIL